MKQRFAWLFRLYLVLLAIFVTQKAAFMWIDKPEGAHYRLADCLSVMAHGLLLDVPVAGYLIALPLLAMMALAWVPCVVRLRRWATPYFAVVALAASVMFVADLSLYPFWHFKLDATIFYYTDSPKDALASVSAGYVAVRLAAIAAYAALLLWLLRAVTPRLLRPMAGLGRKAGATALMLAVTAPLVISIRGGLGESTANIGKVYFSEDEYLNHSAINPCFSMLASLGKADDYASEFDYFAEGERARLFDGLYAPTEADTVRLLNTERPNVLVIIMEGFGGQFVEAVSGREGHRAKLQPPGARGHYLHQLLLKQLPHRPRHGLDAQRLPQLPHPVGDEAAHEEPHAAMPRRHAGRPGLQEQLPLRRRHKLHQHAELPAHRGLCHHSERR